MVTTRNIEYEVDGTLMIGRLALPDGEGTRPSALTAYEGPGHGAAFPGVKYHQLTDERSWRAMIDLFDEVFA